MYRYLVRREREKERDGQKALFETFTYSVVATNRAGEVKAFMKEHFRRGTSEKRIGQFTNEFLSHLPLGGFMANLGVCTLCPTGLKPLVVGPEFGVAERVSKEAHKEDPAHHWSHCQEGSIGRATVVSQNFRVALLVERLRACLGDDSETLYWVKSAEGVDVGNSWQMVLIAGENCLHVML